jgi:hypothetical protein
VSAVILPDGMVEDDHPRIKAYESLRFHVDTFVEHVGFLDEYAAPLKQVHECVHSACAECVVSDVEEAAELAMLEQYLVHVDDMVGHLVRSLQQVHESIEEVKQAPPFFDRAGATSAGSR